jgi:hypothetical protein
VSPNAATKELIVHPQMIYEYGAQQKDLDREKPKKAERKLSQCHFAHHKSYMN